MEPAIRRMLTIATGAIWITTCTGPAPVAEPNTTLTGNVGQEGIQQLLLSSTPPDISDGWSVSVDEHALTIPVAADGAFETKLAFEEPGFHRLIVGSTEIELYLEPAASLELTLDPNGEPGVEFSGDVAAENRLLVELAEIYRTAEQSLNRDVHDRVASGEERFEAELAEIARPSREHLAAFLADHGSTAEIFRERVEVDLAARFDTIRLLYPQVYIRETGRSAGVNSGYYETIAQEKLDWPTALSSASFVAFLDRYVDLVSAGPLAFERFDLPREKLVSRYQVIRDLAAAPEIRDYLLGQMFKTFRTSYGPADWAPVFEQLVADQPNHPLVATVRPLLETDLAERDAPSEIRAFREIDGIELEAHIFEPATPADDGDRSAYLFFHGGGWAIGTPEWGYRNCTRMAGQGMLAISFEYRLADVHGTDLLAAVDDVRFAIAWARENAAELGIDPERIVAAGFSAGGHLATTAAMLPPRPGSAADSRPNALVIHSASYDLTKSSFFDAMTGGRQGTVSPQHLVRAGLVPALLLHGRYDHLAPLDEFQRFVDRMESVGNEFEFHLFDVGHFFRNDAARTEVRRVTDAFLEAHGFLDS